MISSLWNFLLVCSQPVTTELRINNTGSFRRFYKNEANLNSFFFHAFHLLPIHRILIAAHINTVNFVSVRNFNSESGIKHMRRSNNEFENKIQGGKCNTKREKNFEKWAGSTFLFSCHRVWLCKILLLENGFCKHTIILFSCNKNHSGILVLFRKKNCLKSCFTLSQSISLFVIKFNSMMNCLNQLKIEKTSFLAPEKARLIQRWINFNHTWLLKEAWS